MTRYLRPGRRLAGLALAGLAVLAITAARDAGAAPYIEVRFSIKVILDPATGLRPGIRPGGGSPITDVDIQGIFDGINGNDSLMAGYQRGYRYVVDEILDVGATCPSGCASDNPSFWYGQGFPPPVSGPSLKDFETTARTYPAAFQWKANAVNLYINWGQGDGAIASFPPPDNRSNHVVLAGSRVLNPAYVPNFAPAIVVHEMGHYFGLAHPNGGACKPEACYTVSCPNPVPTDGDGLDDTLPDDPCYTLDALSVHHFGTLYAFLLQHQQRAIDDIYWNNMSYLHPGQDYGQTFMDHRTEQQLDRSTDVADTDTSRVAVRSGRTWFVSTVGTISGSGASTDPFRWSSQGKAVANLGGGDIILFKPGTYGENLVFDRPVTLRVARFGTAVIGN